MVNGYLAEETVSVVAEIVPLVAGGYCSLLPGVVLRSSSLGSELRVRCHTATLQSHLYASAGVRFVGRRGESSEGRLRIEHVGQFPFEFWR